MNKLGPLVPKSVMKWELVELEKGGTMYYVSVCREGMADGETVIKVNGNDGEMTREYESGMMGYTRYEVI